MALSEEPATSSPLRHRRSAAARVGDSELGSIRSLFSETVHGGQSRAQVRLFTILQRRKG